MNHADYSKAAYVGLHNALRDGTITTFAERFEVEDAVRRAGSFEELPAKIQRILKPAFDEMNKYLASTTQRPARTPIAKRRPRAGR